MWVKIKHATPYRGNKHEAGAVIEVGDDLGNRMIAAGKATQSSKPEEITTVTAEEIESMDFNDMKKRIAELNIETANGKKETLIAALKAHYGV